MRFSVRAREPRKEPTFDWRTYDPKKIEFPTWLIDGLIPEQATCCIYGAPNTGKSFLALDMALAIATGRQWLGLDTRNRVGKTKERGKVVYVLDENPEALNRRIAAWLDHKKVQRDDGPKELKGYFWIPIIKNLHLDHDKSLDALISEIKDTICPDPALIIFDPLVSFMGGDENKAGDTQDLIKALRKIVETFKKSRCSVLVVHHSGKEYSKGERGSSALRGGVETLLELNTVRLKVLKQRDAKKIDDIPVELFPIYESADQGQGVLVTEPNGNVTEEPPPNTGKERSLGMVVKRRDPLEKMRNARGLPGPSNKVSNDNSGQQRTPTKHVTPQRLTVPQRRALKNRDAVIDAMRRLAEGQDGKVLAAADIKDEVGKKFDGKQSTFYTFLSKLANSEEYAPPPLIKLGDGQYKLALALGHDNQKKPVPSGESLSDSDTSRPATEAAPAEG